MARTHRWRWLAVAAAAAATAAAAAANGNPFRSISRHIANAAVTSPARDASQQKENPTELPVEEETVNETPVDGTAGQGEDDDTGDLQDKLPVVNSPTAVKATNDCLNAINALRKEVGTVEPELKQLSANEPLEVEAQGIVVKDMTSQPKCVTAKELSDNNAKPGIIIEFDKSTPSKPAPAPTISKKFGASSSRTVTDTGVASPFQSSKECESYIRETYNKGLDALKASRFDPAKDFFNIQSAPFNSTDARNLASIMWANNKAVGCAVSTNCETSAKLEKESATTTHHVLYCTFDSHPSPDQKPFSHTLYNAMLGIKLPSSGVLATPTILLLISTISACFAM